MPPDDETFIRRSCPIACDPIRGVAWADRVPPLTRSGFAEEGGTRCRPCFRACAAGSGNGGGRIAGNVESEDGFEPSTPCLQWRDRSVTAVVRGRQSRMPA